jgi:hypothetical protein
MARDSKAEKDNSHRRIAEMGGRLTGRASQSGYLVSGAIAFTHSTCILKGPAFLSLSMKPMLVISSGSTGPMP